MPAMSSASVAVTRPSRSRTCRYARDECLRKSAVAMTSERQDRHRREREPPVEEEEDDRGADQRQRVLDEARDAVGDELVERLDVVREPADDHAGAVPLVVAEREPLQVAEERVAQVGEDALAGPAGEVRLRRRGRDRGEARDDEERDDPAERVQVAAADAVVDRELREVRRQQRDRRSRAARKRIASAVRALYGAAQPRERRDAARGRAPRPVVDLPPPRARMQVLRRAGGPSRGRLDPRRRTPAPSRPCS